MESLGNAKKYLFFDTETTGLPRNYKAPSRDTDNWPRLVQLSWIVTDEQGHELAVRDYIIYPQGFKIPTQASDVHGITTQRALNEGVELAKVLEEFMHDFKDCDYIVGHNIAFDQKIVGAEFIRLGQKDPMERKPSFCTMQSSINYCQIPGYYGYKYPKLQELHKKLFGSNFEDAHNSLADVSATTRCFWEMVNRQLIRIS